MSMTDKQIKLVIGSLLHDIGKIVYRAGDGRNHSLSGYEHLKELRPDFDKDILDCVRYHHGARLKNAVLTDDSPAYITYFADNIAAAIDRREGIDGSDAYGFDRQVPLDSVFNILNGNNGHMHYAHQVMDPDAGINYPTDVDISMDESFYDSILRNIDDNIKALDLTHEYISSLLSVLEANLMYIPSSTSVKEQADISLYDHLKITAAIAENIYAYMQAIGKADYKSELFDEHDKHAWDNRMFLLYSVDLSGIQKFIYNISSENALRGLRARSFYLEILMEHIIDELLDKLELSRSCLIYSGGGHCYMLLPNTDKAKHIIDENECEVNLWFTEHFDIELYAAGAYVPCSANDLKNEPAGSYSSLYTELSKHISLKKSSRYTPDDIRRLNRIRRNGERECRICRRVNKLNDKGRCPVCRALIELSGQILYDDYFIVMTDSDDGVALPLPGGCSLTAGDEHRLRQLMESDNYIRSYTKNRMYTGRHISTKLWIGDYSVRKETFEGYARKSEGIERIAVLRADVDNLGNAFVNGFKRSGADAGRFETISRTAALSRQLSVFFKCYINRILREGQAAILNSSQERQLCIVYSGGDDIFIVGAWNDVTDAFTDIRNAFMRFTQGTLTISGGIGLYGSSYPIDRMAEETAELEDYSKKLEGKNAITLFEPGIGSKHAATARDSRNASADKTEFKYDGRYAWDVYIGNVLGEKFRTVRDYMSQTDKHGKAFLYRMLGILRGDEGVFNRARYVYCLSRLEPEQDEGSSTNGQKQAAFNNFLSNMYHWAENEEDRRQLITAIYLYVYMTRERDKDKEEGNESV